MLSPTAAAPLAIADTALRALFFESGPQPQILWEDAKLKLIVAGLRPGQRIPVHPEALAVYHFLQGSGTMTVDGSEFAVEPGTTIVTPGGASRGLYADSALVFLAVRVG